jgi:hypothetical protein
MRLIPISEILEMEDDEKVRACRGTIKTVYQQSSGTNEHGDWSLQNLIIKDRTGEIKVKLKDHDEVPKNWAGKEVLIECFKSEKHGWVGVQAKHDTWKKKTSTILYVTKAGEFGLYTEGSDSEGGDGEAEEKPAKKGAAKKTPAKPGRAANDEGDGDWRDHVIHINGPLKDRTLSDLEEGEANWLSAHWLPRTLNKELSDEDAALAIAVKKMVKAVKAGESLKGDGGGQSEKAAGKSELPLGAVDENKRPARNGHQQHEAGSPETVKDVKLALIRTANLYNMCVRVVANVIQPQWKHNTGDIMSPDQQQSTIASMFIGAERGGMQFKMPCTVIDFAAEDKEKASAAAKPKEE